MEKRDVIDLLKSRKRGAYIVLVNVYSEVVTSTPTTIALMAIEKDLLKDTGEEVKLNYFSLKKAITRLKKKSSPNANSTEVKKWEFKDLHESNERQFGPGSFKIVNGDRSM